MVVETEEEKRNSYTPLMVAVAQGRSDLVRLYIANNHDPRDAIAIAEGLGNSDILRILRTAISAKFDLTLFNATVSPEDNRISLETPPCLKNT